MINTREMLNLKTNLEQKKQIRVWPINEPAFLTILLVLHVFIICSNASRLQARSLPRVNRPTRPVSSENFWMFQDTWLRLYQLYNVRIKLFTVVLQFQLRYCQTAFIKHDKLWSRQKVIHDPKPQDDYKYCGAQGIVHHLPIHLYANCKGFWKTRMKDEAIKQGLTCLLMCER